MPHSASPFLFRWPDRPLTCVSSPLPTNLALALSADSAAFGPEPRVHDLFSRFLAKPRGILLDLAGVARGLEGDSWEVRRLAALMLQYLAFRTPPERWQDLDELLVRLGLKTAPGLEASLRADVLREGYSTLEPRGFLAELRRRLGRAERIFRPLRGRRTSRRAWEDFIAYARQDCKLVLGRYLFTPAEVAGRFLGQVRTSRGLPNPFQDGDFPVHDEVGYLLASLPDFEAQILDRLLESRVYWVAENTPSELNALVEYPATTVVLVVKPPGSCHEIELKRAGCRRSLPLSVVYRREDGPVPISHRLDGGSMARSLHWDASASSRLARVYRAVHGEEAPLSRTVSITTVFKVPTGKGEVSVLDYFTDPDCFGGGFAAMRQAMAEATAALARERDWALPDGLPGPLGLTVRFLNYTAPAQAILARTSSFRLDRVALYLSAEGPQAYFGGGLGVPYGKAEAKRLADEVLDEVLGVYTPPAVPYRDHGGYVDAALAEPANRARADQVFLALAAETGRVWGTLLGIRGYSRGESFVARNAGLRSCWRGGDWTVEILFMDHDDLQSAGKAFWPESALPLMMLDERHIQRDMACLERIYRTCPETGLQGWETLRREAAHAYRATQEAVRSRPEVRELYSPVFVERLGDWDAAVRMFLAAEGPEWREPVRDFLASRGYDAELAEEYLKALEGFAAFLRRTSFLYGE